MTTMAYLASIYRFSRVLNSVLMSKSNKECSFMVKMGTTYLFLRLLLMHRQKYGKEHHYTKNNTTTELSTPENMGNDTKSVKIG